jgi:hypothetical protein
VLSWKEQPEMAKPRQGLPCRQGRKLGAGGRSVLFYLQPPASSPSRRRRSQPISRVLSRTTIPLGYASPRTSSDLPGSPCGPHVQLEAACSPIWSCSGRGLPCRRVLPPTRCALTAPFHPYRPRRGEGLAVCFLLHFPWAHAPQALPGALPWEPGLSSTLARSGCLADSERHGGGWDAEGQAERGDDPMRRHPGAGRDPVAEWKPNGRMEGLGPGLRRDDGRPPG